MEYIVAIDGGGTKTRCVIGDLNGNILGDFTGGPSNHQIIGLDNVRYEIDNVFHQALIRSKINVNQIKYVYLGLAGADLPSDFNNLYTLCKPIFNDIPFKIINDTWICMRSGLHDTWGAVSICGTGGNAGAKHPDGNKYILRSLCYELGAQEVGGYKLAESALHNAFKADECTGPPTLLNKYLPDIFNVETLVDIIPKIYPNKIDKVYKNMIKIPPLVFELANKGDKVCQQLLINQGHILGEMISGVLKKLNMEKMDVPVVIAGSIYNGCNPLLIDEFTTVLHQTAPNAYISRPTLLPIAGAYLSALDTLNIKPNKEIYINLKKTLSI